jgi:hypothetical protein
MVFLRFKKLTDFQQIDPNLAKIQQSMQELNLKYTIIAGKPTVLVKFTIDTQAAFTLIIETRQGWVSLRVPLVGSRNISALTRAELTNRLLIANTRLNMTSFGLDQSGNVGVACGLPMEDFTPASLSRQVKVMMSAMLYFHNEIGRPLALRYGEPIIPNSRSAIASSARTNSDSFEVEVFEATQGSTTRFVISKNSTVQEILSEATRRLGLSSGDYMLVHNSRKLDRKRAAESAESLLIKPGDALDIILVK